MERHELENMLQELDDALAAAFPDAPPLQALVVGGACLLFTEVTSRQTSDIDLIIFDLMGSEEENSLIYTTPLAAKILGSLCGSASSMVSRETSVCS